MKITHFTSALLACMLFTPSAQVHWLPTPELSTPQAQLPAAQHWHWNPSARLEPVDYRELRCTAQAVYRESGAEPVLGQLAVARVVQNRIRAGFAADACAVVFQRTGAVCQFSWTCEPAAEQQPVPCASCWQAAAQVLAQQQYQSLLPTALFFHSGARPSSWHRLNSVGRVGGHEFYELARTQRAP